MSGILWSVIGGAAAGLAFGCLIQAFALARNAERATSRKGSRLLTTVSPLSVDEVRCRLVDRMPDVGFSVLNADLEDRVVLASGSWARYGFFFPVYLTAQSDGLTLIEVGGVPRGLPTQRRGMANQQARCLHAIEQAVAPMPPWAPEAATPAEAVVLPPTPLAQRAPRPPSQRPRRRAVVAGSGAVLAAVISAAAFHQAQVASPDNTLPIQLVSGSRLDHAMSQFGQRMLADPAISAKLKNLSSARAAFDEGSVLANDGLKRVGAATLERFARTTEIVLQKADDRTCAQYFLSTAATPQLPQTLEKLTDAQLNEYLDVRYTLMAAAAHGNSTAVPLTTSQANAAATLVRTDLGEADTALLGQLSTGQHPDAEVCRIARKLFASTLRLPPSDQALALRLLFQT